ncbi:MAG: FliI/YscN family ATPase [Parvularculaceae bacterium]
MSVAVELAHGFDPVEIEGVVASVSGLGVEVKDRLGALTIGCRVEIETNERPLLAEVVGLGEGRSICLPFGGLRGVRRGARVRFLKGGGTVRPSPAWLGRVVDALGRPIDGKGPLREGAQALSLRASPAPAPLRARLGPRIDFGVKALSAFCPARAGQRLGVFSGSGVGKSALMAMIARNTECDAAVIALIGERGREVREFIEEDLGPEGLARAVVVVATSDQPALLRREAGFLALTLAEHFRDEGAHVLCLMDSLTRFAMAQREIGLAAGEPPASKGYTPSVFAALPALLERAGPSCDGDRPGYVTAVTTVLVEGDDHDEPIADAARAVLDGHIVLDRRIAERGRYPAVNILKSISRAPAHAPVEETALAARAKALAAAYDDMSELIRIGAYRAGSNEEVDRAIEFYPRLEAFLGQARDERVCAADAFHALETILEEADQS